MERLVSLVEVCTFIYIENCQEIPGIGWAAGMSRSSENKSEEGELWDDDDKVALNPRETATHAWQTAYGIRQPVTVNEGPNICLKCFASLKQSETFY